eukprot:4306208-Amphidinium_carterae.1
MHTSLTIPSVVRDELIGVWCQLPLAEATLTAPLGQEVVATDATTKWAGVCTCQVKEPELLTWLWSRRRPKHQNMIYAHEDPSRLLRSMGSAHGPDECLHAMITSMQFRERVRYKFAYEDHINALEGRAWLTAVKLLSAAPSNRSCRPLFLNDSQVWCHVAQRGRSSSRRLNRIMQRALPWLMSMDLYPVMLWVGTKYNPADDPTRGATVRTALERDEVCQGRLDHVETDFPLPLACSRLAWTSEIFDNTL